MSNITNAFPKQEKKSYFLIRVFVANNLGDFSLKDTTHTKRYSAINLHFVESRMEK